MEKVKCPNCQEAAALGQNCSVCGLPSWGLEVLHKYRLETPVEVTQKAARAMIEADLLARSLRLAEAVIVGTPLPCPSCNHETGDHWDKQPGCAVAGCECSRTLSSAGVLL